MATSIRSISDGAGPQVAQILERTRQVSENLAVTSKHLDEFIAQNEKGVARFTDRGLPEFERLLREGREAAKDIRELSRSLKQNPSQLIYEPSYRGVEVPR
jgi:ABC-type transporter Mla subunit MlaD